MKRMLVIAMGALILNGCATAFLEVATVNVLGGNRKRPSAVALEIATAIDIMILAGLPGRAKLPVPGPMPPATLPHDTIYFRPPPRNE